MVHYKAAIRDLFHPALWGPLYYMRGGVLYMYRSVYLP